MFYILKNDDYLVKEKEKQSFSWVQDESPWISIVESDFRGIIDFIISI